MSSQYHQSTLMNCRRRTRPHRTDWRPYLAKSARAPSSSKASRISMLSSAVSATKPLWVLCIFLQIFPHAEEPPACFMVASGGSLFEQYGHSGSGDWLGDSQTEAEVGPSPDGRGNALLRRTPHVYLFGGNHPCKKSMLKSRYQLRLWRTDMFLAGRNSYKWVYTVRECITNWSRRFLITEVSVSETYSKYCNNHVTTYMGRYFMQ